MRSTKTTATMEATNRVRAALMQPRKIACTLDDVAAALVVTEPKRNAHDVAPLLVLSIVADLQRQALRSHAQRRWTPGTMLAGPTLERDLEGAAQQAMLEALQTFKIGKRHLKAHAWQVMQRRLEDGHRTLNAQRRGEITVASVLPYENDLDQRGGMLGDLFDASGVHLSPREVEAVRVFLFGVEHKTAQWLWDLATVPATHQLAWLLTTTERPTYAEVAGMMAVTRNGTPAAKTNTVHAVASACERLCQSPDTLKTAALIGLNDRAMRLLRTPARRQPRPLPPGFTDRILTDVSGSAGANPQRVRGVNSETKRRVA